MKTLRRVLWIVMWNFVGVFIGNSIYRYYDYKANPGLYEMWSVPWYRSIEVGAVFTAVIAAVLLTAIWIIRKKERPQG